MAIAYQGTDFNIAFATTTVSKSITTSGSDVTLVMFSVTNGGAATNTPTFNGVSFTRVGTTYVMVGGPSAGNYYDVWVLPNAYIGTATVTLTQAATSLIAFAVTWYSGTDASQPDGFTAQTESTNTTFSPSVTTSFNNSWTIVQGQQAGTFSAGSGTTSRQFNIGYTFDSNGGVSPGSNTLNMSTTPSSVCSYLILGLKEKNAAGGSSFSPRMSLLGVGR